MSPLVGCVSFLLLLLLSAAAGGLLSRCLKIRPLIHRLGFYLAGPAAITILHVFFYETLWGVYKEQNWTRLQRTIAMAMGFPLYPDPQTGPAMTSIYGPVSALAYWPASWAATPSAAVQTGLALSIFFFFMPMAAVLFRREGGRPRFRLYPLLAFFCFVLFASVISSTKESAFLIHADAPALALSLLACAAVYRIKPEAGWGRLALSASLAVLAVGAKQTALLLGAALSVYVLLAAGRKKALHYLVCLAAAGGVFLALMAAFFDPADAFFYIFYLPSRHPMQQEGFSLVVDSVWRLMREFLMVMAAALPVLIPALRTEERKTGIRIWLDEHPWALFFWVALCMAPLALLSHMKIGGSNNTLSFVTYFLLAGTAAACADTAWREEEGRRTVLPWAGRLALVVYCAVLIAVAVPKLCIKMTKDETRADFGRQAYAYALAHPGTAYFPRLTLVTLMAEKKLYHSADGLMDMQWAGLPLTQKQLLAHVPRSMEIIAFSGEDHRKFLPLAGFSTGYHDTVDLQDFVVYPSNERVREELYKV